ncbi:HAD family hydrolase, partial [Amycolatopsis kentuckyensis]|uniref:HAD family hydrolase n=1 Tax=Amycolatopsis kentuckyensis TaxID=218823 RepID=UPI001FC9C27B
MYVPPGRGIRITPPGTRAEHRETRTDLKEPVIATAVLFDVDGTLVDSNYLHVHAWRRAFHELGRNVDSWRVHRAIGKGSGKLLRTLLGEEDAGRVGDRAKELHSRFYLETADLLRPFDRA